MKASTALGRRKMMEQSSERERIRPMCLGYGASRKNGGFMLLELIVVMAIIAILLVIVIPTYSRSLVAARERALHVDLDLLRSCIWKYTFDKQKALQFLDDLRVAGYIDKIPDDPMT